MSRNKNDPTAIFIRVFFSQFVSNFGKTTLSSVTVCHLSLRFWIEISGKNHCRVFLRLYSLRPAALYHPILPRRVPFSRSNSPHLSPGTVVLYTQHITSNRNSGESFIRPHRISPWPLSRREYPLCAGRGT